MADALKVSCAFLGVLRVLRGKASNKIQDALNGSGERPPERKKRRRSSRSRL